jgi:hypothetical protein
VQIVVLIMSCLLCCSRPLPGGEPGPRTETGKGGHCSVEAEEVVTSYKPANNGAGPLWCYSSTVIARQAEDVFVPIIETGEGVAPLRLPKSDK